MTRTCDTCAWARSEIDDPRALARLVCRESPTPIPVSRDHWCGRFRIAERLTGGTDARRAAA